jgi:PD-(D/E)XK nuclease superfamily
MDQGYDNLEDLIDKHFHDPYDRVDARAVLAHYRCLPILRSWGKEANQVKIEVETDTWRLSGAIDRVVEDEFGDPALMERKTTNDPIEDRSAYWDRLPINNQIRTYAYWGMKTALIKSPEVKVYYEVIRKPNPKVAKAFERKVPLDKYAKGVADWLEESPKTLANRVAHNITEREIEEFPVGIEVNTHIAAELKAASAAHPDVPAEFFWPQNEQACGDYGGCDYRSVCTGQCGFVNNPFYKRSYWAERK